MQMNSEDIREVASAFQKSRVLLTAYDLRLFTHMGRKARNAENLAARMETDVRGLDRLLGALTAMGLVIKRENSYRATESAFRILSEESPEQLSLGHLSNLYDNWATLTRAVQEGGTVLEPDFDTEERREHFIAAMHSRARNNARELAVRLPLAQTRHVLDVGGGSGVYSMAMCRAWPGLRATVLDLPQVTPLTRRYVAEAGLEQRVKTRDGDMRTSDWGQEYDFVFLSAIVHMFGPEDNAALVRRAHNALEPGGRLALVDFLMDDTRTSPAFGALFALNMLVNTRQGDAYTESEVRGWFEQAGFTDLGCVPAGPNTRMFLGTKA